MAKRLILFVLSAALAIVVATLVRPWGRTDDVPIAGTLGQQPEVVRASDPELRRQKQQDQILAALTKVTSRLDRMEQSIATLQSAQGKVAGADARPKPEVVPVDQRRSHGPQDLQALDDALAAQVVDPQWDKEFRQNAAKAFSEVAIAGVQPVSIRCGNTICRLDTSLTDDIVGDSERVMTALSQVAPQGGIWLNNALGGDHRAILFIAKFGSSLIPALTGQNPVH